MADEQTPTAELPTEAAPGFTKEEWASLGEVTLQRWNDRVFPLLRPEEVRSSMKSDATRTLELLGGTASPDLADFVIGKWKAHVTADPAQEENPNATTLAQWAFTQYWNHVQVWTIVQILKTRSFPHVITDKAFVPLLAAPSESLLAKVQQEDLSQMEFDFWAGWHDFEKFLSVLGNDEEKGFVEFVRQKYWPLLEKAVMDREQQEEQAVSEQEKTKHKEEPFVPLFPMSTEDSAELAKREAWVLLLDGAAAALVANCVQKQWAQKKENIRSYVQTDVLPMEAPQEFVKEVYWKCVEEVVSEYTPAEGSRSAQVAPMSASFVPSVPLNAHGSEDDVPQRQAFVRALTSADAPAVDAVVHNKWEQYRVSEPECVRVYLPTQVPAQFIEKEYWPAVEEVACQRGHKTHQEGPHGFTPDVAIDLHGSAEDVVQRRSWVEMLESNHTAAVQTELQKAWDKVLAAQPSYARPAFPTQPPREYMESEYWRCVEIVARAHRSDAAPTRGHESSVAPGDFRGDQRGGADVVGMSALVDATAFAVPGLPRPSTGEFGSSRSILQGDFNDGKGTYEGWVMWHEQEPRTAKVRAPGGSASPAKRTADGEEKVDKPVVDVILLDHTGPMNVTLWGDLAMKFFEEKSRLVSSAATSERKAIVMQLKNFKLTKPAPNDWNGKVLTKMKSLNSKEGRSPETATSMSLGFSSTSPFLEDRAFEVPRSDVCIASFGAWRSEFADAPFRATVVGTVVDGQDIDESQGGNPKKMFGLVDKDGGWIHCCATGIHASASALSNLSEVIIFFGSGRPAIGSDPGSLYLFKDAMAIMVGRAVQPPVKRSQVEITSRMA